MADEALDGKGAEQAGTGEELSNDATTSTILDRRESNAKRRSHSQGRTDDADQTAPVESGAGETGSARGSSRGPAAGTEKDNEVVTGSAEEPAEAPLSPEALEAQVANAGGQADAAADPSVESNGVSNGPARDDTGAAEGTEVIQPDSEAAEGDIEGLPEGDGAGPAVAGKADTQIAPLEGASAEAERKRSSGRASTSVERASPSRQSQEAAPNDGPADPGAVAKELNLLLGNAEAATEPALMSADVLETAGQGDGEIEGFDDDFQVPQAPAPPEDVSEVEPEAAPVQEDLIAAQLQEATEQHARLVAENQQLQKRCAALIAAKGAAGEFSNEGGLLDDDMRYISSLQQWVGGAEELRRVSAHFDGAIERAKDELQARQDSAAQIRSNYLQLEMEVAREAENSRTGRGIPTKHLRQLDATGRAKDEEVEAVRLKSIILKNTLTGLERALKRKEELADGLHQVDFEQLKIENQSLSEKVKVRDEELAKLRKKVCTTVHILTHQKEKLQHVHRDAEAEGLLLESLEREVAERRDRLQRAKRARDAAMTETKNLKLASGLITQPELLSDVAAQKELAESLTEKVHALQQRHATLTASLSRAGLSGLSTPLGFTHNGDTGSAREPPQSAKAAAVSVKSPLAGRAGGTPKDGSGRLATGSAGHTPLSTTRSSENVPGVAISARSLKAAKAP
ncbi:hypothetical protein KFL_002900120 [Klebsormidium nitens]|uniref:CCDC113/CCDC96 coiled-coil domain-containing protein n=1 Tax=Klebsormidium nitens TaxID=105231 RepID=A0A1Y1IAK4_KLENI|nr:hypothetical protein KFL_002900120 [Klebsormidium nitens]|eukprot:GAQ86459.1 hypothetical protein KFL_002900120 [Klebsormidium nitens]